MAPPIQAPLIENVQVIHVTSLEVMPPRNPVLAAINIAQGNESRHKSMSRLKVTDGNGDVENWLGGNTRNSVAADMLDVQCAVGESLGNTRTLLRKTRRPLRAHNDETNFSGLLGLRDTHGRRRQQLNTGHPNLFPVRKPSAAPVAATSPPHRRFVAPRRAVVCLPFGVSVFTA